MPIHESSILRLASIIEDAAALGQAVLEGDRAEALFCADRVVVQAPAGELTGVAHAALLVIACLGRADHSTVQGCGSAIEALSVEIDRAQTHDLT